MTHQQSLIIISGDNHASLATILPNFTQYVDCHTGHNKILDFLFAFTHCITNYINVCWENTVATKEERSFSNNKPWVTLELKGLTE